MRRTATTWHCVSHPALLHVHRSKEEIQQFEQFAKQDGLHKELFSRIAPNIYGSDDIKKAVACLLFGGSRKVGNCAPVGKCFGVAVFPALGCPNNPPQA